LRKRCRLLSCCAYDWIPVMDAWLVERMCSKDGGQRSRDRLQLCWVYTIRDCDAGTKERCSTLFSNSNELLVGGQARENVFQPAAGDSDSLR